jgi:hypothetical protein
MNLAQLAQNKVAQIGQDLRNFPRARSCPACPTFKMAQRVTRKQCVLEEAVSANLSSSKADSFRQTTKVIVFTVSFNFNVLMCANLEQLQESVASFLQSKQLTTRVLPGGVKLLDRAEQLLLEICNVEDVEAMVSNTAGLDALVYAVNRVGVDLADYKQSCPLYPNHVQRREDVVTSGVVPTVIIMWF